MPSRLRHLTLSGCAAAALVGLSAPAAYAQTQTFAFDIPAQDLASALRTFARQSRQQVIFQGDAVRGKVSRPLKGAYGADQGLAVLLGDNGLSVRRGGRGVLMVGAPIPPAEAGAAPADEVSQLDEVVVTGSLIRGAVPAGANLKLLDEADIRQTGVATVAEVVQTVPQSFRGAAQEASLMAQQSGGTGVGFTAGTSLNLRGIGADATLVLVNGRRVAPAGYGDFVDVSAIPLSAMDRIEILADGASATYGSDALAGVVNLFLKRTYSGVQAEVRYGAGDGLDEYRASLLAGRNWTGGHVMASYEYYERSELLASARPYTASADLRPLGGQDYRSNYALPGNIIFPTALAGAIPAGQDGRAFRASDILRGQTNLYDARRGQWTLPRQQRHAVFVSAAQELGERVEVYLDGLFSDRKSAFMIPTAGQLLSVPSTNYYRQQGGLTGADPILINYNLTGDLGLTKVAGHTQNYALAAGGRVEVGAGWRLDAYLAAGENRDRTHQPYPDIYRAGSALEVALASSDPATAFNPFGDGGDNNPAVVASLSVPYAAKTMNRYRSVNAKLDGRLFDLPGGAVKLAAGAEYREETYGYRSWVDYASGAPSITARSGDRKASALFGELYAPLVGEANARAGLRRLEVSLSVRYDHYDDFGGATNPKVGVAWSPIDGVTLQGSWGASFKAPRLDDLYRPQIVQLYPLSTLYGGPDTNGDGQSTLLLVLGGNPNLTREKGEAWTAGVTLAPEALPGFRANLTYFRLKFEDRIAALPSILAPIQTPAAFLGSVYFLNPSQAMIDGYIKGASRVVNSLPLDTPVEAIIVSQVANVSQATLDGLDLEVSQAFNNRFGQFTASASFTTYMRYSSRFSPTAPSVTVVDAAGYPVDLRGRAGITWAKGDWGGSIFANYQDDYRNNTVTPSVKVKSQTTFDLQARYDLDGLAGASSLARGVTATLSVSNLFDKAPPFAEVMEFGYDAHNYSPVGRFVALNISKSW